MALYWKNPNSFEEVEALYNSIKPLAGGQNKGKDIRPAGDRRRKMERVHKFTDNCYGLMDGGIGDPMGWWANYRGDDEQSTEAEVLRHTPIVWRRHKDGSQTVTIRNESGHGAHNSRYSFLDRHIPHAMRFSIRNGKHFIVHGGKDYYLAKSMTFPAAYVNKVKADAEARGVELGEWFRGLTARDDSVALTFKRVSDGNFVLETGGKALPKPPRTLVKKAQKAKHKKAINDFWDWVVAMAPMMPVEDWNYRSEMHKELYTYALPDTNRTWFSSREFIPANIAIRILTDYNNPMRLNMAVSFVEQSDIKSAETVDDAKRVRAQYNRWINKICGFTVTK
jgi:hypothetical protein